MCIHSVLKKKKKNAEFDIALIVNGLGISMDFLGFFLLMRYVLTLFNGSQKMLQDHRFDGEYKEDHLPSGAPTLTASELFL